MKYVLRTEAYFLHFLRNNTYFQWDMEIWGYKAMDQYLPYS